MISVQNYRLLGNVYPDADGYAFRLIESGDPARPQITSWADIICNYFVRVLNTSTGLTEYYVGNLESTERLILAGDTKYTSSTLSNIFVTKYRINKRAIEGFGEIFSYSSIQARTGLKVTRRGIKGDVNLAFATWGDVFTLFERLRVSTPEYSVSGISCWMEVSGGQRLPAFVTFESLTSVRIHYVDNSPFNVLCTKGDTTGTTVRYFYI
jgi:hypothetical protein